MTTHDPVAAETEDQVYVHPALHVLTPIAVLAATWVVRKSMSKAYESVTGRRPPIVGDVGVSVGRAVLWAATTAATAAITEVLIYRMSNRMQTRPAITES